jgi:hypothetical protein
MDWLDETIDDYNRRKAEKKKIETDLKNKLQDETNKHRLTFTKVLGEAHEKFQEVKRRLIEKGFPSEVSLEYEEDPNTAERVIKKITLLVQNEFPEKKVKLDQHTASSLIIRAENDWNEFTIFTKNVPLLGEPVSTRNLKSDMLNDVFIEDVLQKFIRRIFQDN